MADRKAPRNTEPVPVNEAPEEEHDFNPVVDDEDTVIPGIVPPEGHEFDFDDDESTAVHESELEEYEEDIAAEYTIKTKYTDGSTWDPSETMSETHNQGLVYTPPTDPPVIPSDSLEGVEVAAGFAPSMEESHPDVLDLPDSVDNNDDELADDVREALRLNSETQHLDDIHVFVADGVVTVRGTVETEDDLGRAEAIITDLPGVRDVISEVELSDESLD